jgi:transcriptional regulator with XRE-family HTH domain
MSTGEKIAKERRLLNLTQDQLADKLSVTRQAVSRWESDLAYPETDKLIALAKLFSCDVDYLLNNEMADKKEVQAPLFWNFREYKSKKCFHGVPLVHVAKHAKGIVAIGLTAEGVVSIGLFSLGLLSIGVFALGLLTLASFGIGLLVSFCGIGAGFLSFGGVSLGVLSFGGVSVGVFSIGGLSIGEFAVGGKAIANYGAFGGDAEASVAIGIQKASGGTYSLLSKDLGEGTHFQDALTAIDKITPASLRWCRDLFVRFLESAVA